MLQTYISSVSYVSEVCCKGFVWMLHIMQWLYSYVVNVYSQCFIHFFIHTLQACLCECYICFTHMLYSLHTGIRSHLGHDCVYQGVPKSD
jgi:hypothetical protein